MTVLLRITRTDRAVEVQENADGYLVRVARLRGDPETKDGLTAAEALHALADALRRPKGRRAGQ